MKRMSLERHGQILLLGMLLAIALSLRLYGQDWDQGTYQHPDERFIAMVSADRLSFPALSDLDQLFSPKTSPINPRRDDANGNPMSFAYGTLPLYVQGVTSAALNVVSDRNWNTYSDLYRVGRTLTALIDTLTVAIVFLIGRRLFNRAAGFVAAGLYTFSVLAIQLSHFFAVDTWLTLFVTAAIYLTIRFIDAPTLGRSLAIGAVLGLAFATKASVPSLLAPVIFGYAYVFWRSPRRPDILIATSASALLSVAVFTLFEPYALIRSGPFIEDIRTQARIVRGITDVPFTRQFVGLTPGVYELRNLFAYTIGPGFLLGAIAGLLFTFRRAAVLRDVRLAIPLLWVVAYIPTLITTEARFLRYTLPLLPTLAVLTGGFLVWLIAQPRYRRAGQAVAILVVSLTAVWAIGFVTIYTQEHSRIAASKWIHENIPPGSVLSAESWDDPLPARYPGAPPHSYEIRTLDIYGDRPPEEKVDYLYDAVNDLDYVILSSNRLVYSVDNLPWRYAVQNEFYRRLDAGQLGFQLVYEGLVQPGLFGISFDDRQADESFTVYDRPHVRIYEHVDVLDREAFRDRMLWSIHQPWEPRRYPSEQRLLLDQPVAEIDARHETGWNSPATGNGIIAAISWLLAIEIISLSTLPLAARLLHRSPDRGALSSRLIGLVLVGWLVWIGASLGLWPATLSTVVVATLGLAAVAWLPVVWKRADREPTQLPSAAHYLSGLGVFTCVFLVFLLLRGMYPDFWQTYYGGEKPFELAYLRAVANSTGFPPYDPWYADGIINYYYYGWHMVASLVKLSGVGVAHGFQLAVATVAGLLVVQCVAIANLLTRRGPGWLFAGLPLSGLLIAFFAVVAGNLDGLFQVAEHRLQALDLFDFWRSTRVIDFTINEFPFFALIWADLHPHVMNLPHYVLLLTLLTHMIVDARARAVAATPIAGYSVLTVGAIALVLGTIALTNAWDAPLAIGLTVGAFVYAGALRGGLLWLTGAGHGMLCAVASFAMFAPFYRRFYSVVDGVDLTSDGSPATQFLTHWGIFLLLIAGLVSMTLLRRNSAGQSRHLAILLPGVVLLGGLPSVIVKVVQNSPPGFVSLILVLAGTSALVTGGALTARVGALNKWTLSFVLVLAGVAGSLALVRPAATIAGAVLIVAVLHALSHWRYPARFLPWALIAVAAVTIASVEIIYVADDLRNSPWERMNTVFKFYVQAWLLMAIGCGLLVAMAIHRPSSRTSAKRAGGYAIAATLAVAMVAGLIYPSLGTPARLSQDMPGSPTGLTLDGYAWMEQGWIHNGTGDVITFKGDLEVIEWLADNVEGTPVILEASIGPYRGNGSRISSATGLPTVLGWDRHQRQQRYEPGISQRMRDVRFIYNEEDPDAKLEMLRRYNVRYVIVGDVERLWNTPDQPQVYATPEGLAAFEILEGDGLTCVFSSGETHIYAVDDFPRLPAAVQQ